MPVFRIHRMKDAQRQQFRSAPHISGAASVRPKDYEPAGEIDAENEYAAWAALRTNALPLAVGDLLENSLGMLQICKYVGFDEARWFVPEQAAVGVAPASSGSPVSPATPVAGPPAQA